MAKIKDGMLTISAAYGVKVPGAADFSSQEARLSIDLAYPVEGEYDALIDSADVLQSALTTQLKLAVYAQLGLGVEEKEDGTIAPDFSTLPARVAAAPKRAPSGAGGGGGGGRNFPDRGPSKAQQAGMDIPTYTLTLDGQQVTVQDWRPLKEAGVYSAGAADFRIGENSYWLLNKDKTENPRGQKLKAEIDKLAPFEEPKTPTEVW